MIDTTTYMAALRARYAAHVAREAEKVATVERARAEVAERNQAYLAETKVEMPDAA